MSKVFHLHKEGNNNIVDWVGGTHLRYGDDVINQIQDPQGATAKKEITSIPSPFARIDLAKAAFKQVAEKPGNDLTGNTIYHKIVSDCLDVGEIFFNYQTFKDKVEIIVWDRQKQLDELLSSPCEEHGILGRTLQMYLEQDKDAYNFGAMDRLYLLKYTGKHRKTQMDIIGATSPATLFFSSANDLSYVSSDLKFFGNDQPFDDNWAPLYKRDFEYQKYLYAIRAEMGRQEFARKFPEIDKYLESNYQFLSGDQKDEIDRLDNDSRCVEAFPELTVNNDKVEVLGVQLRRSTGSVSTDVARSAFRIDSKIHKGTMPLVLPVEEGNEYTSLKYIQANWDKTYHAPYYDDSSLSDRILPHMPNRYPYLTISDFLTPSIISMPYGLTDSFFDGNSDDREKTFLLPLTPTFFDFFTVEQLMGTMRDGKRMIEIESIAGGSAGVTLRIPIQDGRYISYRRLYIKNNPYKKDRNEGGLVEQRFGLGVLPLVHNPSSKPFYRVAFFAKKKGSSLSFFSDRELRPQDHVVRREPGAVCGVESYVLEENFDKIFVTVDGHKNAIVPKFKKTGNATEFTFAVDFGTTNTHIEYSVDGATTSHAFDITRAEKQMCRMHKYGDDIDIKYAFDDAFVPDTIADNDDYSFPIRTAFAEHKDIDYKQQTNSLANGNIPFRYEKAETPKYHKVKTDIKWSDKTASRVEIYLDNLAFLMRNKVLLNGGDLSKTKLIWFYPISMTKARCDEMSRIWKRLYEKYFGEDSESNLVMMSESVAPYYYHKKSNGLKSDAVTIDIGGGTTDVYIVDDNEPKMLSSFRFAANAVFGDGYNYTAETNGFVRTFEPLILSILNSNRDKGLADAINAYEGIKKSEKSSDIIAFFFSLANNNVVKSNKIPLDFLGQLSTTSMFKYPFILFYGAILYYVARMMRARDLRLPQTIAFSGNGSKTLLALASSKDTVARFASLIFEKVYGKSYGNTKLDVIYQDEPKLATCKGGCIAFKDNLDFSEVEALKTSLLGTDAKTFTDGLKFKDVKTDEMVRATARSVSEFIDFLFSINSDNKQFFKSYLGADTSINDFVRNLCKEELVEFTKQGIESREKEIEAWGGGEDSDVEETMFFYPLVAVLNKLARRISK